MRTFILFALIAATGWAQTINTYAGNGAAGFSGDNGPATQAQINRVVGMAADSQGNIYLADELNNRVRKIAANGVITTFAGTGAAGFSGDGGPATAAALNKPLGVCVDSADNVYINDYLNYRVRKVAPNGIIATVAGSGASFHSGDGGPATGAGFVIPIRCAVDATGNLYIADQGAHRVRRVTPTGTISTFAGTGFVGSSGDGGPATAALLNNPTALAVDATGNVYINDQYSHRIRRVDPSGTITAFFGNGANLSTGDGGPATSASIGFPGSMVVDSAGVMYVADTHGHTIRKVAGGIVTKIAGTGGGGYSGDGGPALQATMADPFAIALDFEGNVFFADTSNNRIRVILGGATVVAPALGSGTLANGATYVAGGLVPGSWAQVKGTSITRTNRIWTDADFANLGSSLPTTLSGVSVTVNGTPAAVYYISPNQVSFQVPSGISGTASVRVTRSGVESNATTGTAAASSPGIFPLIFGGKNFPAGRFTDGRFTGDPATGGSAYRKAVAGESIELYATGLQVVPAGSLVTNTPISGVTVTIGTTVVPADFAGLVGVGLFQINFKVPSLPAGEYPMTISVGGVSSPATINSEPPAAILLPIQ